jgi:von Willebrand factor type A domain
MRAPLTLLLCATLAACGTRDTLTPGQWTGYVPAAETGEFEIRVRLAEDPPSLERTDILLLFDVTQSMRAVIDEVRTNARTIMRAIRARNPNSAFGLASFADYQEHLPWRLDRDITEDLDSVSAAIARLRLYDGKDFPEAYSRALYEARFVGWRPGAKRFVILFGDAPAHDPNFYGQSTGVDPGRDGIPGNEDDLRFAEVVRDLAVDRITVLVNYVPGDSLARKGFEFLAAQTGGAAIPVADAKQVPATIVAGLNEQSFARPTVAIPPEFADWVRVSNGQRTRKGDLREYVYSVDVSVPPRATAGIRRFPLVVKYEDTTRSVEIGATRVTILTGWQYHPVWRWLLLALALLALLWWLRRARRRSARFLHSGRFARLFVRLVGIALFALVIYIGWRYLEGAEQLLPEVLGPRLEARGSRD